MSSVLPSNAPAVPTNGQSKRIRTSRTTLFSEVTRLSSTSATKPLVLQTPSVAVLALGTSHVATLHFEAQPFLRECVEQVLDAFATTEEVSRNGLRSQLRSVFLQDRTYLELCF